MRAFPRRVRRALQRQWGLPLAGVALMLALGQSPGLAATIPVGGACTLVDALAAANTDTAMGGCPAGSGADTIVLLAGSTQTLTEVNNSTYGPTGLPVVSSVVTIEGLGSTIVRDSGAPEFRLFAVSSTGDLTLTETTVSGGVGVSAASSPNTGGGGALNFGTLTVTHSTIAGNFASFGGGVRNFGGTVTVTHSTIVGNRAFEGGGVVNDSGGTLTVTRSTISGNSAAVGFGGRGYGGGVANVSGTIAVAHSIISGNFAGDGGGGVLNRFGTLTVINSTIAGNNTYDGGGMLNAGGTLTVTNSTISGNAAFGFVGGGGMLNAGGTLTVTNSTIAGNATYSYGSGGGGVLNAGGTLTVTHTLVSGNTAPTGPEIANSGTVLADNHNLFGVDGIAGVEGFSPGPTDIVPPTGVLLPDILNPTLAFNGGPTQTHALVPDSPAIDAGGPVCLDATGDPLPDQRGQPRLVDGDGDGQAACDIGAFEFFPLVNDVVTLAPAPETAFDPTPVPNGPAGTFTITATFTNTSDTPLRVPFVVVTELSGGNLLLNAAEEAQGVGATVTPEVGDEVLSPGETVAVDFVIGLHVRERFTFFVDLFGEPMR